MPTKKRRIKILRPRNAAPNTAFTQVSRPIYDGRRKIRVAMDPSDLADDSPYDVSSTEVKGVVLYCWDGPTDVLCIGCRTPERIDCAITTYWLQVPEDMRHDAAFLDPQLVKKAVKYDKELP